MWIKLGYVQNDPSLKRLLSERKNITKMGGRDGGGGGGGGGGIVAGSRASDRLICDGNTQWSWVALVHVDPL